MGSAFARLAGVFFGAGSLAASTVARALARAASTTGAPASVAAARSSTFKSFARMGDLGGKVSTARAADSNICVNAAGSASIIWSTRLAVNFGLLLMASCASARVSPSRRASCFCCAASARWLALWRSRMKSCASVSGLRDSTACDHNCWCSLDSASYAGMPSTRSSSQTWAGVSRSIASCAFWAARSRSVGAGASTGAIASPWGATAGSAAATGARSGTTGAAGSATGAVTGSATGAVTGSACIGLTGATACGVGGATSTGAGPWASRSAMATCRASSWEASGARALR